MPFHEPPEVCPVCRAKAIFRFIQDHSERGSNWSLYECPKCGVQFWLPFEGVGSGKYEEEVIYTDKLKIMSKENCRMIVDDYWNMSRFLKKQPYSDPKGKKLLDLGCGTGEFLAVASEIGYDVCGVDFNENAVNFIKEKLGIKNVFKGDVIDFLKDKQEKYDVVTAFEIVEHTAAPTEVLKAIFASLKPGGYLALSVPNRKRNIGKIDEKMEPWDFPYQHLTRWDARSLEKTIERCSFEVLSIQKEMPIGWFMARIRFLIERVSGFKDFAKKEKKSGSGPIEKIRADVGMGRYKLLKNIIKVFIYPIAFFFFYGLGFEGGSLYVLAKKR